MLKDNILQKKKNIFAVKCTDLYCYISTKLCAIIMDTDITGECFTKEDITGSEYNKHISGLN